VERRIEWPDKGFTPDQISFLLAFMWWERDFEWIRENSRMFSDIELFMKNARNG